MDAAYYAGLDVGGTSMKAGVVDADGRVLSRVDTPTGAESGPGPGLERMCATIREAIRGAGLSPSQIAAVGVAVPGLLDIPAGVILAAPNLPGWTNVPVREYVRSDFGVPTAFQNDANAAALGECRAGAGKGADSLVLFTLGTGVGGGIVWKGRVIEGRHSHAGELGHHRVEVSNPRACGCGRHGCLEAYASATAVVKRAREELDRTGGASPLRARGPGLTARDVFEAADAGDVLAGRVVAEAAFYLAVGATNLMHVIDPEVVVFGGGMMTAGESFLERIRGHVRRMAFPVLAERTRVCAAELGTDAGFIGAAGCGRQLVKGGD